MFSPSYFRARRHDLFPDPNAHCGFNVALYGSRSRWAFTEPGPARSGRCADALTVGASSIRWEGETLVVRIDERTPGISRPIRGEVRLHAGDARGAPIALDAAGRHLWWCLAPGSRVEVALDRPQLSWRGSGYLDSNFGREPLESAFAGWTWSRAQTEAGTAVLYDAQPRHGPPSERALLFGPDGGIQAWHPEQTSPLARSRWRLPRSIRDDRGSDSRVIETLEDSPFYARSLVATRRLGQSVTAVHETLDLDRFVRPVVQRMLPFRMRGPWRR